MGSTQTKTNLSGSKFSVCISCNCASSENTNSLSNTKEILLDDLQRLKPNFNQLSEKKLVKIREWLLERNEKDLLKYDEFVYYLTQDRKSLGCQEDFTKFFVLDVLDNEYLSSSGIEWAIDEDEISCSQSSVLKSSAAFEKQQNMFFNTEQLKKKLLRKHYTLHLKNYKQSSTKILNSYKKPKSNLKSHTELKKIKRKQVLSQLNIHDKGIRHLSQYNQDSDMKTIKTLNARKNSSSGILGEPLKELSDSGSDVKDDSLTKQYVFN